jgi:hypothetical protein
MNRPESFLHMVNSKGQTATSELVQEAVFGSERRRRTNNGSLREDAAGDLLPSSLFIHIS